MAGSGIENNSGMVSVRALPQLVAVWAMALAIMLALSGCFDKEADQRKAFAQFLQSSVMHSGVVLPSLSVDQKKRFGAFVPYYSVLFRYSQQVNQTMDAGINPLVATMNRIRQPRDYVTHSASLRQSLDALSVLEQQLANASSQAQGAYAALKMPDDLRAVYEQVWRKVVAAPAVQLQRLMSVAQTLTRQLIQLGEFIRQQGSDVRFVNNGIQFSTQQQVDQYNMLVAPLQGQYQQFEQEYGVLLDGLK